MPRTIGVTEYVWGTGDDGVPFGGGTYGLGVVRGAAVVPPPHFCHGCTTGLATGFATGFFHGLGTPHPIRFLLRVVADIRAPEHRWRSTAPSAPRCQPMIADGRRRTAALSGRTAVLLVSCPVALARTAGRSRRGSSSSPGAARRNGRRARRCCADRTALCTSGSPVRSSSTCRSDCVNRVAGRGSDRRRWS